MSSASGRIDNSALPLPFGVLVSALDALGVPLIRRGEELVLTDAGKVLTGELVGAVRAHKPSLLSLCDLRAGAARLFDYGVRLRCEDPPKGSREQALGYQARQIDKLANLAEAAGLTAQDAGGAATGYLDPADPFAEDALILLREDLTDLTRPDAPYPVALPPGVCLLPPAGDVLVAGRLLNGRLKS